MKVFVERVGERRIHLTTEGFSRVVAAQCKSIIGANAKWDRTVTPHRFVCWTYPLDFTTCLEFRRVFGDQLVIGPELTAWAREEKQKRAKLSEIIASQKFDLPSVEKDYPALAHAMASRPYQQVGAAFLAHARRALLADEPGLGKTLQSMGACVHAGLVGPVLVTAPSAAAQLTWPDELGRWLPGERVYPAIGNRQQRQRQIDRFFASLQDWPNERHWLVVNFEMMRASRQKSTLCPAPGPYAWTSNKKSAGKAMKGFWHHPYPELFDVQWAAIIADESQRALVTRTPNKEDQTLARAGMGMLRIREDGLRIALSGTPFRGKLENLWGTLNWLRPDLYTSYWNWVKKWFETFDDGLSLVIGELYPHKEEEFYRELDGLMIRRTKKEAAPELPGKLYAGTKISDSEDAELGVWIPMSAKQEKAYHDIVEHAAAQLESGKLLASGVLAEMTRLKQFAGCYGDLKTEMQDGFEVQVFVPTLPSNKFDWVVEWLDERGIVPDSKSGETSGDGKVVIASQFTKMINLFNEELNKLGVETLVLTGETNAKNRRVAKDTFQGEGGPRVFLLNTQAGGVSLTLDAADDLIFLDEDWIPDNDEQVEDRIHRVSRIHQVTIWKLRSLGTIDETVGATAEMRDTAQKKVLDGRRGVEFARKLLVGGQ